MNARPTFTINPAEKFPHLDQAPIVEAVIHWRARSEKTLDPEKLLQQLMAKLPKYPHVQPLQEVQFEAQFAPEGAAQTQRRWLGFRFETEDRRYIAQFTRNGFVFSRVTPYENWDLFSAEAMRLWQIHLDLFAPSEIERLGVRFINRIVPVGLGKLEEIMTLPPQPPDELLLPIGEFLHRNLFDVPGHAYRVHVIQTSQLPVPPENATGLIVDIDVYTTNTMQLDDAVIDERLDEMRWLKNKAFYALITEQKIEQLKDAKS